MRVLQAILLAATLASVAAGAVAQERPSYSVWGGPDNPGGLFGTGDPHDLADANRDGRLTHDEIWLFAWQRLRPLDRNGDGVLSRSEMTQQDRSGRLAFGAAANDATGDVRMDRLKADLHAQMRRRDRNRDGALSRDEMPVAAPAAVAR